MRLTLKQARLIRGFTQEQMAEALGVHVHTYMKIEQNPEKATVEQVKVMSKKLNMSYDDIFFGQDSSLTREDLGTHHA